ncbi:MAG: hypothetical protein KTR26_21935 [Flammeovirgaceae bacterium]|nr:hypothetical protein [Flammeovirgaceae bacterium]
MKNKFFLVFITSCLIGFNAFSQVEDDDLYFTMADRQKINKRPIFTEDLKPADFNNEPQSKFANPDFKGETTTKNPTAYNYFSEDFNLVDEDYVFGSNSMNHWNNSRYWNTRNSLYYNSPYSNSFYSDPFYSNNMMGYNSYNPYSSMMSPYGYSPYGYSPFGYSPGLSMGMGFGSFGNSFGMGYGTSFGNPYSGLSMGIGMGSYYGNRYNRRYNYYGGAVTRVERANTVTKTRAPRGGMTRTGNKYTPASKTAVNQLANRRMYSSRIAGTENRSNYSNSGRYSNSNKYNYSNRSGSGNSNSWNNSYAKPTRSSNSNYSSPSRSSSSYSSPSRSSYGGGSSSPVRSAPSRGVRGGH